MFTARRLLASLYEISENPPRGGSPGARSYGNSHPTNKMHDATAAMDASPDMDLRGRIFTDLDRLAFALEMEAAEHLERGRAGEYLRVQERRLGVRLAQRLVSGVPADEVNGRMERWEHGYDARLGLVRA